MRGYVGSALALLTLVLVACASATVDELGTSVPAGPTASGPCDGQDMAIFTEFPHLGPTGDGKVYTMEPGVVCAAVYEVAQTPPEVTKYYRNQLRDHGWEIVRDDKKVMSTGRGR